MGTGIEDSLSLSVPKPEIMMAKLKPKIMEIIDIFYIHPFSPQVQLFLLVVPPYFQLICLLRQTMISSIGKMSKKYCLLGDIYAGGRGRGKGQKIADNENFLDHF